MIFLLNLLPKNKGKNQIEITLKTMQTKDLQPQSTSY
jgi:hypothetical protein